ncbi:hypothetical protein [Wenzhouxiangella sp. EGI_FJ10305]|uniref:hypothetical protein n=1 Tax=Wenzhouxiangella sp. EGI_FJ10305 TaxID=3243768 RepID=UPI0035E0FEF3
MKPWLLALLAQVLILSLGFGLMGSDFTGVSILHAPVVNLLLWTSLITFAGLAARTANRPLHRGLTRFLLLVAIAWFPVSLAIFGNARFSGTTDFLWQAWLISTGLLIVSSLLSLIASAVTVLLRR